MTGKPLASVGKQSASGCRDGQTIVKQLSNSSQTLVEGKGRVGEFAKFIAGEFAPFRRW